MNAATELDIHDFSRPLERGTTLIEASAGTGKTYTIAAIFLRLVLEHELPVGAILVTTFTKPATAELRERIRTVLHRAAEAFAGGRTEDAMIVATLAHFAGREEAMRKRLEEAVRDFDEATIQTMHGFCQRVLAEFAFETGLPGEPELVPDESVLLREVSRDFWRRQFYECEECFAAVARSGEITVEGFQNLLALRLQQPLALLLPPVPADELSTVRASLPGVLQQLRQCWASGAAEVERQIIQENGWAVKEYAKPQIMAAHLKNVAACLASEDAPLQGFSSLAVFSTSRLAAGKRKRSTAPCHAFYDLCEELEQLVHRYRLALQAEFLAWAPAQLEQRKRRANQTSYSDLLSRVHSELHGPRGRLLAERLRERYAAALIDEFQDTDPLQDAIFRRIFGREEDWLFLIGDPKQAIYGFRGADIFTYLKAAQSAQRRLTLGINFRSTPALVAAVNAVFARLPRAFVLKGIDFQPVRAPAGSPARKAPPEAPLRLWHWQGEKAPRNVVRGNLIEATAAEVARLLGGAEAVAPAEIAVLTMENMEAWKMQQALAAYGVPAVLLSGASVFTMDDARELLAVLSAAAHPAEEGRIRAALLTDWLGVTPAQLYALEQDEEGWERWRQRFLLWHSLWVESGFIVMFRHLVRQAGIRSRLLALPDSERRLTNVLHLSELVQKASAAERMSPTATVKWLAARVREPGGEEENELRLERDDEAVRIVTVHKSKGLEYDIVFCPLAWKGVYRKENGPPRFHTPEGQLSIDLGSPDREAHRDQAAVEALAEQVRQLYVALTRARRRCDFTIGQFGGAAVSAMNWLFQPPVPEEANPREELERRGKSLPSADWEASLQELVSNAGGSITLVEVPSIAAPFYVPRRKAEKFTGPRVFQRTMETDFGVSSFSSLTADASAEVPEEMVPIVEDKEMETAPEGMHAFPAGPTAGLCLHEFYERLDFQERDEQVVEALAAGVLAGYGSHWQKWASVVAANARRVLSTPLADGFRLGDVAWGSRLVEREFHLPAGRLAAETLPAILGPEEGGAIRFKPRRGWLKGFIDLVFRHEGRFYIADWKSNRLGNGPEAYRPAGVNGAMAAHHYALQAHLYALALQRYLGQRLRGYRHEEHFGGIYYFFLRGIDSQQPELGVWHRRPALKTLRALETWLEAGR